MIRNMRALHGKRSVEILNLIVSKESKMQKLVDGVWSGSTLNTNESNADESEK